MTIVRSEMGSILVGTDFVDAVTGTAVSSGTFGIVGIDREFHFSSTQTEEVSRMAIQQAAKRENLIAVFDKET